MCESANREYKTNYKPTDEDIIDSLPFEYQQDDLKKDMINSDDVVQHVGLHAANWALATLQTFLEQPHHNAFSHVRSICSLQNNLSMCDERISPNYGRFFF